MDKGAWWATMCGVAESDMTERLSMHTHVSGGLQTRVIYPQSPPCQPLCWGLNYCFSLSHKKREKMLWGPHCYRHNHAFFL